MAHPQQQQQPGKSVPQLDNQEHLHYPGDEGKRPELVQPDVNAQVHSKPRNVRDAGQHDHSEMPDLKPLAEGSRDHPPINADLEEPIGDRKDIR